MSDDFDIRGSIKRIIERSFADATAQAQALAEVTLMLKIPMDLATSQEAKGNAMKQLLPSFKNNVRIARAEHAEVMVRHAAGNAQQYEVDEAFDELQMHIDEQSGAYAFIAGVSEFHREIQRQATAILAKAA